MGARGPDEATSDTTRPGRRVALIAAPQRQLPFPARPSQLFGPSEFFTLAITLAGRTADRIYILSPRYGLLVPDGPVIAPYRIDPPDLWPPARRRAWAEGILAALLRHLRPDDICVFYTGRAYRETVQYRLTQLGYRCEIPLQGLTPDSQIEHLRAAVAATEQ